MIQGSCVPGLNRGHLFVKLSLSEFTGGIEDEKSMGDISFGDFKSWLTNELRTLVKAIALEEMADTKKEVADLKKKNKELSDKLTAAENKVT